MLTGLQEVAGSRVFTRERINLKKVAEVLDTVLTTRGVTRIPEIAD